MDVSAKKSPLVTSRLSPPVEIEEPLQSIVVENGSRAIFECKITGNPNHTATWSKDGVALKPSRRYKMTSDDGYHRLEIRPVSASDHAVYTLTCTSSTCQITTEAVLHVAPNIDVHGHGRVSYVSPSPRRTLQVTKHLYKIKVKTGERVDLLAQFASEVEKFIWYKSNKLVVVDDRISISNRVDSSELAISKVQFTDIGVYLVIAITKYGIASSCSYVCVIDNESDTNNDIKIPFIEEPLPYELEVSENDEVQLMCKCEYNSNTEIQWLKNGIRIGDPNIYIEEQYGNQCLGLRIMSAHSTDSAQFSVVLRDDITGNLDTSQCYLTVNESALKKLPAVHLTKPIESALVCIGSEVCFSCSFTAEDFRYFYVIWHVGHYRIERSNSRFDVVNKQGEFLLRIKEVDVGMNGEVTCELRRALPNQKSVLMVTSSGNLTIVPQSFLMESGVENQNGHQNKSRARSKTSSRIRICPRISDKDEFRWYTDSSQNINREHKIKNGTQENRLLEITFCRLEDEGFCYLNEVSNDEEVLSRIGVYKLDDDAKQRQLSEEVVVEWLESSPDGDCWYAIDLRQANGDYVGLGVTSAPLIRIKDPPVGKPIRLRITPVTPLHNSTESTVCISPSPGQALQLPLCELLPMNQYMETFTETGDNIGCGAFGSVMLVRDEDDKHYAAKVLKTRTQKKRDTALREYEMMRMLKHPKLVELHASFVTKDTFILVMDYLWGGELLDRIVEEEYIREKDVVPYVKQICEGLEYLHSQKIAHLDLKPENIICLSPNSLQIKIIDFGLARILDDEHLTRAIYGTRDYVAPEVLNFERLTLACDMWSLGVVTYMLLSGIMPFAGDSWPERSANITMANYNYKDTAFKEISDLAKDFVDQLLVLTASKRMSATEALSHQWIKEGPPRGAKAGHMKKARENLKSYLANYRARWQRAGNVMIAAHRLRTQAGNHRNNNESHVITSTPVKTDV